MIRYFLLMFALLAFVQSSLLAEGGDRGHKIGKKAGKKGKKGAKKSSALGIYTGYRAADYKTFGYDSRYLAMPDSVRLAIDVFKPAECANPKRCELKKAPTLVYFVRYCRTLDLKPFFRFAGRPYFGHVKKEEVAFFTAHGYNCVIVDLRGSGASFGHREMEFSPQEVEDMKTVMDWIVAQPWSDGKIATTGISYTGTTAEFALATRHPALKACIPRSGIFDLYADMNFVGGIRQSPFIKIWKFTTQGLDRNDFKVFGGKAKMAVRGVMPVNGQYEELKAAVKEHEKNYDIFAGLYRVECRDDKDPVSRLTVDDFSVHRHARAISEAKVPIYRISGWYDGANVNSAIKGFWNTPNTEKLLLGAWDHGPEQHISPFDYQKKTQFDVFSEMLRFLDFHMLGIQNGIDKEPAVAYFQMGTEEFKRATAFPPTDMQMRVHALQPTQLLANGVTQKSSADYTTYQPALPLVGTGGGSRWNTLTPLYRYEKKTGYPERSAVNQKMLCFTLPAEAENLEITGHARIDLYISSDTTEAPLFVYLEDVDPKGRVTYITEGVMLASHRKEVEQKAGEYKTTHSPVNHTFRLQDRAPMEPRAVEAVRFELLPTSYLLRKGHSLRVSIATSDADHFDTPESLAMKPLRIYHNAEFPTTLHLPVVPTVKSEK